MTTPEQASDPMTAHLSPEDQAALARAHELGEQRGEPNEGEEAQYEQGIIDQVRSEGYDIDGALQRFSNTVS